MKSSDTHLISVSELKQFMIDAKRSTFAGEGIKVFLNDNSAVYSYKTLRTPRFIYTDVYKGNIVEGGKETVSLDRVEIWQNQYYGGIKNITKINHKGTALHQRLSSLSHSEFNDVVVAFLKQSLMQMPENFPVRGSEQYETDALLLNGEHFNGCWCYKNNYQRIPIFELDDVFLSFTGFESISLDGMEVFWHSYHGGLIIDKHYNMQIIE